MDPPDVPEDLLRAVIVWRAPEAMPCERSPAKSGAAADAVGDESPPVTPERLTDAEVEELRQRHTCPICHDVMLQPRQLACRHHACARCLASRLRSGGDVAGRCPHCNQKTNLEELSPPADGLKLSLAYRRCACAACGGFEGTLEQFKLHLLGCQPALGVASLRVYRLASENEERRLMPGEQHAEAIASMRMAMLGASPALVHHIPACAVHGGEIYWSSPPFTACGHLWTLRSGPVGATTGFTSGSKYFCFLPVRHEERLRCNLYFARKPGEGFKERRLHNWPPELSGQPFGVTLKPDELERFTQADGSLLVMVHAVGLGGEEDELPLPTLAQDSSLVNDFPPSAVAMQTPR